MAVPNAMENSTQATSGLVQGKAMAAPGGTPTSPSHATEPHVVQMQSPSTVVEPPSSEDHTLQPPPEQDRGMSGTSSSSLMEKRQKDVEEIPKTTKTKLEQPPMQRKVDLQSLQRIQISSPHSMLQMKRWKH